MDDISFTSLKKALNHKAVKANYGLLPNLGKYHMTACTKCYKIIDPDIAKGQGMKCSCGGRIKKGVLGRIEELATYDNFHSPAGRPPYRYVLPLAELLSAIYKKGVTTKFVQSRYDKLIELFGNEINVLINVDVEKIASYDKLLARVIKMYRLNKLNVIVGRGGRYGQVVYDID
jgi:uncharacterized protein (TIGR00375 family)